MKATSINQRKLICPKCTQQVCYRCRDEWHGYFVSCESYMMGKFEEKIVFCPMCSVKISKTEGCNHMTCLFCKYEFCWVCGGESTADHFNLLNPLNCGATQFMDKPPNKCLRYLFKFSVMALVIIMLPMVLLLACPIFCASVGFAIYGNLILRGTHSLLSFIVKIPLGVLVVLFCFCIGVFSNVVVIPCALLVMGVSSWLYIGVVVFKQCRSRSRAK